MENAGEYFKNGVRVIFGVIKVLWMSIWKRKCIQLTFLNVIALNSHISVAKGSVLRAGKMLKMRSNSKICVRKGATVQIGENFFMNENSSIVSHESITIGKNVMLGPGVLIYDHDHDFSCPDGLYAKKYKTSPVVIGNNVWIGANSIILRGTTIGDNLLYQQRTVLTKQIKKRCEVVQTSR